MIPPVATKGRRHHGPELRQAVARRSSPSAHLETWCYCFVKWFSANIGFLVNCGHVFSSDLTQTWKWYSGVLALAALEVVEAPSPYLGGRAVIHVSSGQQALSKTEASHVIWVDLRTEPGLRWWWWWWWGRREPPLIVVDQLKQYLRPVFGKQGKHRKAPSKWAKATIALCVHGLLRIILETKIQDEKLWQLPKSAQIAQYLTFKLCAEGKEQVGGIIRSLATFYSASTAGWVADENAQKLWILGASQVNSQGGKYSNVSFTFRTSCPCFLDKTVQVLNAEYFGGQIP